MDLITDQENFKRKEVVQSLVTPIAQSTGTSPTEKGEHPQQAFFEEAITAPHILFAKQYRQNTQTLEMSQTCSRDSNQSYRKVL